MTVRTVFRYGLVFVCLCSGISLGQEWTRFRGPDGTGTGNGDSIPVSFTEADYNWKVKLPGPGHSSPVLWGNLIFLTCSHDKLKEREVICLDAGDGRQIWSWKTGFEPYHQNRFNSFAASTPAVDEDHVYIAWISGGRFIVLALDHNGNKVWERDLGKFKAQHGAGGSPIVLDGVVIAGNDNASGDSFLIGLDAKTGDTRWRHERKSNVASYITPAVYRPARGPAEVIFACTVHGISSLDPGSGKLNWELGNLFTQKSVASPVVAAGIVFATAGSGGRGRESAAVRPGSNPVKVYSLKRDLPYVPTPIAVGGLLFVWSDAGVVTCVDPGSGKIHWSERVGGQYFSSPVCVADRIYAVSRGGELVVIRAADKYKLLARNKLPEGSRATPAIANGCMYIRTFKHLISIGGKGK